MSTAEYLGEEEALVVITGNGTKDLAKENRDTRWKRAVLRVALLQADMSRITAGANVYRNLMRKGGSVTG